MSPDSSQPTWRPLKWTSPGSGRPALRQRELSFSRVDDERCVEDEAMSVTLVERAPVAQETFEDFMSGVFEVQHPLIACHLTRLRDKTTPPAEFRQLVNRLASLLAYEATKDLK